MTDAEYAQLVAYFQLLEHKTASLLVGTIDSLRKIVGEMAHPEEALSHRDKTTGGAVYSHANRCSWTHRLTALREALAGSGLDASGCGQWGVPAGDIQVAYLTSGRRMDAMCCRLLELCGATWSDSADVVLVARSGLICSANTELASLRVDVDALCAARLAGGSVLHGPEPRGRVRPFEGAVAGPAVTADGTFSVDPPS